MLKFTHHAPAGRRNNDLFIAAKHIISVQHANPSGALINTTRGGYHVAQSVDQVLTLIAGNS